jgi:short-subunit dehydrogenase
LKFEVGSSKFVYDLTMLRLAEKVVAITGASAGIGRACADRLSREGAAVSLFARRTERLEDLAGQIRSRNGRVLTTAGDVTSESDVAGFVDRTVEAFGQLDVMICNAGIGYHGSIDETPPSAMRRVVDVNLMGTLYAAHAAMRVFRRQGRGHLIAISSIVGRRGVAGSSVYSATKAAQLAFIEALRAEFVGTPFEASVVFPVATDTEFQEAMARDFGHAAGGAGPRQSADDVARAVVKCVVSPKPEVYPYRRAWLLAVLSVIAPAQADRVVTRYARRRKPLRPQ